MGRSSTRRVNGKGGSATVVTLKLWEASEDREWEMRLARRGEPSTSETLVRCRTTWCGEFNAASRRHCRRCGA